MTTVFVTGGAGFVGSHTILRLIESGYDVIATDNFVNSVGENDTAPALERIELMTGKKITFYQCDLLDYGKLNNIFSTHRIDCVVHFGALKSIKQSMEKPLEYYKNNVGGTVNLLEVMKQHKVFQLVFSSSCCVYGNSEEFPIKESFPTGAVTSVYGRTKYFMELIMKDVAGADRSWNIVSLRYFNPIGAHPSGLIGEDPTSGFMNLMPLVGEIYKGNIPKLTVFGMDYKTPDGTGIRDYIHILDLADGHVKALGKIQKEHVGYKEYNLGIGKGVSVLEFIKMFKEATSYDIPFIIGDRRLGDVDVLVCDGSTALKELGWEPKLDFKSMCCDYWKWLMVNPKGYRGPPVEDGLETTPEQIWKNYKSKNM